MKHKLSPLPVLFPGHVVPLFLLYEKMFSGIIENQRCSTVTHNMEEETMPFINSKVNVKTTLKQRQEIKNRLGKAISIIPGKSEAWLMLDLEDDQNMYFRGDNNDPIAFISVNMYGSPEPEAFEKMTVEITRIFGEVLGVKPDHMYVKYDASLYWGWNGSNF